MLLRGDTPRVSITAEEKNPPSCVSIWARGLDPNAEEPTDRFRTGAHQVVVEWMRMAVAETPSPCFYRMRGRMKIRMNSTEVIVPLQCRCTSEDAHQVECVTCHRSFHLLCDANASDELGSTQMEEMDTNLPREESVCKLPSAPLEGRLETQSCERHICYPCRQSVELE